MRSFRILITILTIISLNSCKTKAPEVKTLESEYPKGSFGHDLDFLRQKDSVIVLNSKDGDGQIIISPKYQAKVWGRFMK